MPPQIDHRNKAVSSFIPKHSFLNRFISASDYHDAYSIDVSHLPPLDPPSALKLIAERYPRWVLLFLRLRKIFFSRWGMTNPLEGVPTDFSSLDFSVNSKIGNFLVAESTPFELILNYTDPHFVAHVGIILNQGHRQAILASTAKFTV
ncbi:MAG: DUF2867 domain-containing protein, partial [Proteobacteria bacterium]|nr:DUF2867 domain-containing protein [Pseudomonadota bacterium]NDD03999.1 DUF2867 domain-containing protein [Pseudomonadota bacterium]